MQELKSSFISNFIEDNRWRYITDGLKITLFGYSICSIDWCSTWILDRNCPYNT